MKKKILLLALALGLSNCIPTEIVAQGKKRTKNRGKSRKRTISGYSIGSLGKQSG